MTSREEIERLLNQTGRTLEVLPERYDIVRWNRAANMPGAPLDIICHQSDVIELLVGALRDALDKQPKWISVKERLPEKIEQVCIAYMPYYHEYIIAEYAGYGEWVDKADLCNVTRLVTHWMPINPPKEDA